MSGTLAQQALADVVLAVAPGGFEKFMADSAAGIQRKIEATNRLSDLIKEGMSPTDATSLVILEFARDRPVATAERLKALALPLELGGADFTPLVRPVTGQSTMIYEAQLATFREAQDIAYAKFVDNRDSDRYTPAEIDRIGEQFDAVRAWSDMADSELALSGGSVADTPVDE